MATLGDVNIGVRDLRDNLSRHLARVKEGETITVTDHGKPVARLVPLDGRATLAQLIAEGRVTPAQRKKRPAPEPVDIGDDIVSDLIAEQRG